MKTKVFMDIHPKEFKFSKKIDIFQFRNALHWKNYVISLEPKSHESSKKNGIELSKRKLKDMSYSYNESKFMNIKNNVRNVLHKRGLISENVYESYKYDIEGDIVDVSKVIEGNPECMLKPAVSYTNYFYELYISLSIPYNIDSDDIEKGIYTILATLQLLEQEHIFTKVNMIIPAQNVTPDNDVFIIVPLFSHKDNKNVGDMVQYLNTDALRVFYFAVMENAYPSDLNYSYGQVVPLDDVSIRCYNIVAEDLASSIINKVIIGGKR